MPRVCARMSDSEESTLPLSSEAVSVSPDITALTQLLAQQMQASEQRERQVAALLESITQQQHSTSSSRQAASKNVAAERPVLMSSATLADFAAWEELWQDFSRCQHLSEQNRETRVAAVRQCFDEDLRRFLREGTIVLPRNPDSWDIIAAVQAFLRRQRNPLLDRIDFYSRHQQRRESFDSFLTSLKELHRCCDFPDHALCRSCSLSTCASCKGNLFRVTADTMRDRIVIGILEDATRHKLLAAPDLTLDMAVQICRAEEAATHTGSGISASTASGQLNAARKSNYQRQKSLPPTSRLPKPAQIADQVVRKKCPNCGRTAHTKSPCPAAGRVCNGCQSVGHFQSVCPRRPRQTGKPARVGHLKLQRASATDSPTVVVDTQLATEHQPVPLSWIPDMGSDVDAIGIQHLDVLGGFVENLNIDADDVCTADGTRLQSVSSISAMLTAGSHQHMSTLHIYHGLTEALLSRATLSALGFLPSNWPKQVALVRQPSIGTPNVPKSRAPTDSTKARAPPDLAQIRTDLIAEFADVFADTALEPMNGPPMDIQLQPEPKPFCVHSSRSVPFAYRDQVKQQLDTMVTDGVIEPVSEPSEWCHPIVVVNKKGTTEKRMTVDFKRLNDQVQRPTHPMTTPRGALSGIRACIRSGSVDAAVDLRYSELLAVAKDDPDYQTLLAVIRAGFPSRYRDVCPAARPYWTFREHLSVADGLVLKGPRVVVPCAI